MRRLEEQILTEKYRKIEGKLTFSVRLAELSVAPGEAAEGAFTIFASQEEIPAQGYVLTKDERMECKTECRRKSCTDFVQTGCRRATACRDSS